MQASSIARGLPGLVGIGLLVVIECAPAPAHAQERDAETPVVSAPAQQAADAGAFASWTVSASPESPRATARVVGGYDGASEKGLFDSVAEAHITGPLSLRAGGSYAPAEAGLSLRLQGKLAALSQDEHGVDLAVVAGYESNGFNEVSALAGTLALGKSLGRLRLLANVGYARGIERGEEHNANAALAALYRVTEDIQLGVDSRFRIDLERDDDEPAGEREWDVLAGPQVTVTHGSFAVTGGGGAAANRLRLDPETRVGGLIYLGVGAAF
jgi:hypothetical protein